MPDETEPDPAATAASAIKETADAVNERTASVAKWIRDWTDTQSWIPDNLQDAATLSIVLGGIGLVAWILYAICRPLVLAWVKRLVKRTGTTWDDQLFGHGLFRWLTHLLPAIFIYIVSPGLLQDSPLFAVVIRKAAAIYLLIAAYFASDASVNACRAILRDTKIHKHFSLAVAAQVTKLIFFLFFFILIIATLVGKSPIVLLGGLGVIASVLMLIFKDVILGFVAGIQLSGNDMLAEGDWLEMPSHNADGDVMEIGLTTVKVRNWDKTITTIPTYALISQPFKNWRGMQLSGGRRIKRSFLIDTNTIQLCTPEMLERFRQIEHISEYLDEKQRDIAEYNARLSPEQEQNRVNGRRLTNVGTFRAYIERYLKTHPEVNQEMTIIVRQLKPEGQGLPIEVYCFCANKQWAAYESIQADIFDHLLAVAQEFDLRIFQQPTGLDFHEIVNQTDPSDTE